MQSVVSASSSSSSSSSSQTEKGKPRRSPCVLDGKLVDSFSDAGTVYEMVKNATEKYGNHVAMQYYEFVELKKIKATDRFPSKIFSHNLRQITYNELGPKIANYGRGLRVIGMEPQPTNCSSNFDTATGKFTLVIFEDTCPQWSISMQGALSQSMVVATCYATLGDEAVISAVNETGATAIVVNWKKTKQFCELAQQMPTLQTIIASTHELPPAGAEIYKPSSSSNVQVVSFDDIMKMGQDSTFEPKPPKVTFNLTFVCPYLCSFSFLKCCHHVVYILRHVFFLVIILYFLLYLHLLSHQFKAIGCCRNYVHVWFNR